jgi:hypothetical protein
MIGDRRHTIENQYNNNVFPSNNSFNLFSLLSSSSQSGSGTLIDGDWPRPETVTIDLVGSAATNHHQQRLNSENKITIDLVLVSVIPYMGLGNNNTITSTTITHHHHPLSDRAVAATCLPKVEKRAKLDFNKLETHSFGIFSGNGRLTLPNTTKTIINITATVVQLSSMKALFKEKRLSEQKTARLQLLIL